MHRLIQHFSNHISHLSRSTRRLYLSTATKALVQSGLSNIDTTPEETLRALRNQTHGSGKPTPRLRPFLRFLDALSNPETLDREAQTQLAQTLLHELQRFIADPTNSTLSKRRDAALIAASAFAPRRTDLRRWPLTALKLQNQSLRLWSSPVEQEPFKHALRLWLEWRTRLGRAEHQSLFPNQKNWPSSHLLFPGPKGQILSRSAVHNALKRLRKPSVGEGTLTLQGLRTAFLIYWSSTKSTG